tara:strand:+ start:429 stop:656 length:228 start_codon:yes stop_codon:yes gene_type:complete
MTYFVLFWLSSGLIASHYIYYQIKFNVKNPNFNGLQPIVYIWLILLGIFLGAFLFYRAQDEQWIQDLLQDLEEID